MPALDGTRVLDLSRLAPGPFCSMLLADMGADVLLVEAPPTQLHSPEAGPSPEDPGEAERELAHDALRRNKRSLILNLKDNEGRRIFHRLAESADVVLEGFRPGVVARLGVDYATLSRLNPRLVYCSLSGYGQDGPYADLVGHDINYISIAGVLGMIGWPGTPPAIPLNLLADYAGGGLLAAFGIVTALLARQRTGRGQYVDVAMSDGVLYLAAAALSRYFGAGEVPRPGGTMLNGAAPWYNVYETADGGYLSIGSIEPHFFANLCRALDCENLIPHEFDESRWPAMRQRFAAIFRTRSRDEWFALLRETDVCVAPVYSLPEALEDPQNRHRGMVDQLPHPRLGSVRQVGVGLKLSETPGSLRSLAPVPGAHTEEVLTDLGYATDAVAELRARGVVASAP